MGSEDLPTKEDWSFGNLAAFATTFFLTYYQNMYAMTYPYFQLA